MAKISPLKEIRGIMDLEKREGRIKKPTKHRLPMLILKPTTDWTSV
jgi:hypothetical protein